MHQLQGTPGNCASCLLPLAMLPSELTVTDKFPLLKAWAHVQEILACQAQGNGAPPSSASPARICCSPPQMTMSALLYSTLSRGKVKVGSASTMSMSSQHSHSARSRGMVSRACQAIMAE